MNEQLTTMLADRLRSDPNADPLTTMLLEQIVASASAPIDAEVQEEVETRLARAERSLERARQELVAANAMAEWVATAVGACPRCWGLDRFCRACSGGGSPGSRQPDLDQLIPWIEPAFRRAGLAVVDAKAERGVGTNDLEAPDVPT